MPRSLRRSFSLRLGKGSGFLVFDHEAGANQSCVCPVLVRVMPGRGGAGLGAEGDSLLTPTLLSGLETGEIPRSRCSAGMTMLVASSLAATQLFWGRGDDGTLSERGIWERIDGGSGEAGGGGGRLVGSADAAGVVGDGDGGIDLWSRRRLTSSMARARKPFGGLEEGGFINSNSATRALASRRPSGVVSYLPSKRSCERDKRLA